MNQPLLVGIGEDLAQLIDVVRLDRQQAVLVAEAGQMLHVGLARRIRIDRRPLGAAVERALDGEALDRAAGVARARLGHQLGVDVGDAAGERNRFGTRVQAQEMRERRTAAGVADLARQRLRETQLADARRHDVGHDLRAARAPSRIAFGVWPKPSMP